MIIRIFKVVLAWSFLTLIAVPLYAMGQVSVSGIVTVGKEMNPAEGVRVMAWPVEKKSIEGEAPFVSDPTAADGLFRIKVPPGSYYLLAQGKTLYGFYGPNPLQVPESGIQEVFMMVVERNPPEFSTEPQVKTGILGRLTWEGEPVEGAVVTVYGDLENHLKKAGLGSTAATGPDGIFEAEMPPGTYYLVARKRHQGAPVGPLRVGDFFGIFAGNPLRLKANEVVRASIAMIQVPDMAAQLSGNLFGSTGIRGRVVDRQGNAVTGMQVMLYDNPLMQNQPLFSSSPTSIDGRFVLSFPKGGVYWIAARNRFGGPPSAGELYGRYAGSPDGSIQIKTSQVIKDIEIAVEALQ